MSDNLSLEEEAKLIAERLRDGSDPIKEFSILYQQFGVQFELIVEEIAKFELIPEHLEMFLDMQQLYVSTKTELGEHCLLTGPWFLGISTLLADGSYSNPEESISDVIRFLSSPSRLEDSGSDIIVVAIARSSLRIATNLISLLNVLENLKHELEGSPVYKRENMVSVVSGITGALAVGAGIALLATPAIAASVPAIVAYSAHFGVSGGAVAAAGAILAYKGFSKRLFDSNIKVAIEKYVRTKQLEIEALRKPVHDMSARAKQVEMFIALELRKGITLQSLAEYVDAYYILEAAYHRSGPPQTTMLEKVKRFLEVRQPIVATVAFSAAVGALGTVTGFMDPSGNMIAPAVALPAIADDN